MPRAKKTEGPNRSEFIRSMPDASVADVIKAAKDKGITIKAGLVYAVRNAGKTKPAAEGAAKPGRPAGSKNKSAVATDGELHNAIKKLAWTHGFNAVEAAVRAIKESAGL